MMNKINDFVLVRVDENSDIKKILHVESVYSILLYLIINKGLDDTLLLISDILPRELSDRIPNIMIYEKLSRPNRLEIILASFGVIPKSLKKIDGKLDRFSKCELYGHDHLPLSTIFRRRNMVLIEDGLSNYVKKTGIYNKFKSYLNLLPYGYRRYVKKIYLTGISDFPIELESKINIIDISQGVRDSINDVQAIFPSSWEINKGADILLTQPLEDMGISEGDKNSIYKKLVDKRLFEYHTVYIKPHPRESTNYSKVFSGYTNVHILEGNIPIEVYAILSNGMESVTTLFSTSAYTIKKISPRTNVNIIGTEWNKELTDKFGLFKSEIL